MSLKGVLHLLHLNYSIVKFQTGCSVRELVNTICSVQLLFPFLVSLLLYSEAQKIKSADTEPNHGH